jgi:hypothetical protein
MSTPTVEIPEFRSTAERGGIELSLAGTAREPIGSELFTPTRQDQQECGGYLFGPPTRSWHRQVEIHRATRTGNATRTTHSLKLDADEWRAMERAITIDGLDDVLCGTWHSHLTHATPCLLTPTCFRPRGRPRITQISPDATVSGGLCASRPTCEGGSEMPRLRSRKAEHDLDQSRAVTEAICVETFRPLPIGGVYQRGWILPVNHPAVRSYPAYFRGLCPLPDQEVNNGG